MGPREVWWRIVPGMAQNNEQIGLPEWLAGWQEWLEKDLFEQVHGILLERQVFRSWNEIVDAAVPESKAPGLFHNWVNQNYFAALAMGVRRMCDLNSQTRSLARLLEEIKEHASSLTKDWWMGRWYAPDEAPPENYVKAFATWSSEGEHVDPEVVQRDLDILRDCRSAVTPYVNKYVAHLDKDRASAIRVTLGEVHAAAESVYRVFHRWYQLVTNVALSVPVVGAWEQVFTVRWITDEKAREVLARREVELRELEKGL